MYGIVHEKLIFYYLKFLVIQHQKEFLIVWLHWWNYIFYLFIKILKKGKEIIQFSEK